MKKSDIEIVKGLIDEVTYIPKESERKLKARFWAKYSDNPAYQEGDEIPLNQVVLVLGSSTIEKSWNKPNFKEWFLNKEEHRERARYHLSIAQDRLEELLSLPLDLIKPSDLIKVIQLSVSMSGEFEKRKQEIVYADSKIAKLDSPEQLADFIAKLEGQLNGKQQ